MIRGRVHDTRQFLQTLWLSLKFTMRAAPREFLSSVVIQILTALLIAGQLVLLERVFSALTGDGAQASDANDALFPAIGIGVLLLLIRIGSVVSGELSQLLSERVNTDVQHGVVNRALGADLTELDDPTFHDKLLRARRQVGGRTLTLVTGLLAVIRSGFSIAAIGVIIWLHSPQILLAASIGFVPSALLFGAIARLRFSAYQDQTIARRERLYLVEVLTERASAKEARLFGMGHSLRPRHDQLSEEILRVFESSIRRRILLAVLGDGLLVAMLIGGAAWGLNEIATGSIDLASGGVIVAALLQLLGRLRSLSNDSQHMQESVLHIREYLEWADEVEASAFTEAEADQEPATETRSFHGIRFEDVSFRYPGTEIDVIEGLSFELRPGQLMVVRGPNGSGKSTLMLLLSGLVPPTTGTISFLGPDGTVLGNAEPDVLRRSTTALFQDFARLEFPIDRAVAAGEHEPDTALAESALTQAGADEFIDVPLRTPLERMGRRFPGGREFSSGQWQRVALARALYRRRVPIVILDEPTSMQDARSAAAIRHLIEDRPGHRCLILVTHAEEAFVPLTDIVLDLGTGV